MALVSHSSTKQLTISFGISVDHCSGKYDVVLKVTTVLLSLVYRSYLLLSRLFAPFKFYNPHPRICFPSVYIEVRFLYCSIPQIFKLSPCVTGTCKQSTITSFCLCLYFCNILQPLHSHISYLQPESPAPFIHTILFFQYVCVLLIHSPVSHPLFQQFHAVLIQAGKMGSLCCRFFQADQ